MCCLTLYILSARRWLQPRSSGHQARAPAGTPHCARQRPERGGEDKDRSHVRKLNYPLSEQGMGKLLYAGFKNSLTLLCTCGDTVFGVAYGCVSPSSVLAVSLQGRTPFAISQQQELPSLGRLGARANGSKKGGL